MAGLAEEETFDEQDKGTLMYQEAKVFHTETFLCSTYDSTKRRYMTFEVFGMDTQEMQHLGFTYQEFDGLFRFNAELMNPNRKEGRCHWIFERLAIVTVGKERKLQLKPEPSEEVPELPVYETVRKIPTGRMDLKERQRLRESMDMLDIKRAENIKKARMAAKKRFLERLFAMKEEAERRKAEVDEQIKAERESRADLKAQQEDKEAREQAAAEEKAKSRRKAVEVKEQRTEEQDEEEYKLLRQRWRDKDAEKALEIKHAHEVQAEAEQGRQKAEADKRQEQADAQAKREAAWTVREERIQRKAAQALKATQERKAEILRQQKMLRERNLEFVKVLHTERQPIFKAQLQRTEERKHAALAEVESVVTYVEKRSIPKKVKKKGKNAKTSGASTPAPMSPKGKKNSKAEGDGTRAAKVEVSSTDAVLDSVESKMRAEMEEARRREKLEQHRKVAIDKVEEKWTEAENEHMKDYREAWRQAEAAKERARAERRLIMKARDEERQSAEARKSQELERLQKVREANILRKEQQRLATAGA